MAKSNIRSIRISDEILQAIESQAGENFTAKFEAMITRCMWELPEKERQLKATQDAIEAERKRLTDIRKKCQNWMVTESQIARKLLDLDRAIDAELKQYGKP